MTPENEESCWIDDPLTSEDEFDSQWSIMEASCIGVACNVIVQDDSASKVHLLRPQTLRMRPVAYLLELRLLG